MTAFAAFLIALLVGAAFYLKHHMICRKYNSSQFNDHQRMVLCLAATTSYFTESLIGDFRDAHFDAIAIHRAVALTEQQIARFERTAPEEHPLRCAAVLSELRERLAHLNLLAGNCDRRVANMGGDLQLISQH
jgi:ABC-type uncharacterized transport system permease subunit